MKKTKASKNESRLNRLDEPQMELRLPPPASQLSDEAKAIQEKALEIMRKEYPAPGRIPEATPSEETRSPPVTGREGETAKPEVEPQPIPARMLNEFVYCQRLFYYEFVEGVFVESADTVRGNVIHKRVDSGTGALPAAKGAKKGTTAAPAVAVGALTNRTGVSGEAPDTTREGACAPPDETIHSRSVQMGSDRLKVVAKMDLVEVRAAQDQPNVPTGETGELSPALEVCPVDYKAGAPKEGDEVNELWDTDKMQLGLQALILRDNGYVCNEGVIYYRATKQRVRLPITPELELWILQKIAEARRVMTGPIPAPLVNSPKCVRCSLAPVCLPDETRLLAENHHPSFGHPLPSDGRRAGDKAEQNQSLLTSAATSEPPRRLIAARDDTRPLYLNTPGFRVGCKDEVLQVKDKDKVVDEVRLRDLSHVALFGNIQISTQAIQTLCEQEKPITYFSMGGWFYGITRGHEMKNVFLRMEQFRLARDETKCLSLARQFVHGKIRNHRTMLMRNHVEPPEPIVLKLKRASEDALAAKSLEELLGIEGAAASQYFQYFSGMVKVEEELSGHPLPSDGRGAGGEGQLTFNFATRNRRPPTDPVNAMLSLAYSMLAKDCTLAALAVGFDPYIGFYHQPRFGRPAFGLDLMEEMRPLIAESVVLSCINNRVVTEKDFVCAGQAVNLTPAGRKRFFQMYEQRMSSIITHPLFEYKVSYRRALELQARLLAKTLTGEIQEYVPLLTR